MITATAWWILPYRGAESLGQSNFPMFRVLESGLSDGRAS